MDLNLRNQSDNIDPREQAHLHRKIIGKLSNRVQVKPQLLLLMPLHTISTSTITKEVHTKLETKIMVVRITIINITSKVMAASQSLLDSQSMEIRHRILTMTTMQSQKTMALLIQREKNSRKMKITIIQAIRIVLCIRLLLILTPSQSINQNQSTTNN